MGSASHEGDQELVNLVLDTDAEPLEAPIAGRNRPLFVVFVGHALAG
jgi:hypothetical protein